MRLRGAECRLTAGFPVSAVSAVRFEGCRPFRSVSTPSVPVATRSGVIAWVSGVADLLSTRSVPFRPSFRGIFDSLWVVSTLSLPVSTLSDPLTGFRPSLSRGIPCLTLPLFQPFISVVLSKTQTPLFTFPVLSLYSLACRPLGCFTLTPPAYKSAGGCEV